MKIFRYLSALIVLSMVPVAYGAELYFTPTEGDFIPAQVFGVDVRLDTAGQCINAVNIMVTYPTSTLEAIDFSRGESVLTLWPVEPVIDNRLGTVTFTGGIPGGYCGRVSGDPNLTNSLGKIIFRAATSSLASGKPRAMAIGFSSDSSVLLNDGRGTPAPLEGRGVSYRLLAQGPSATNEWLVTLAEDRIPPEAFTVSVSRDPSIFDGKYFAAFSATDKQSGIDHYEVMEVSAFRYWPGKDEWTRATSPYLLRDQSLRDIIRVKAVDKAGNFRIAEFNPSASSPIVNYAYFWITVVILLIVSVAILGFVMHGAEIP